MHPAIQKLQKTLTGLFFALIVVVWLWQDFIGLSLSVISTYFYFGWEGTPNLVVIIFCFALFIFSGPTWYRLLLQQKESPHIIRGFVGTLFVLYVSMSFIRSSDFFAWMTLLGATLSSVAIVAIISRLQHFRGPTIPTFGFFFGVLLYQLSRCLNDGLMTLFVNNPLPFIVLTLLVVLSLIMTHLPLRATAMPTHASARAEIYKTGRMFVSQDQLIAIPVEDDKVWPIQIYMISFGLLFGLSIGLLYNPFIWSAQTPHYHPGMYLLTFGVGTLAGLVIMRLFVTRTTGLALILFISLAGVGLALREVLYPSSQLSANIMHHTSGCLGLSILWSLFFQRFHSFCREHKSVLPFLGLQIGFLLFLFILSVFLLHSNPNGFWLALVGAVLCITIVEFRRPVKSLQVPGKLEKSLYAIFGLLLLPGLLYVMPDSNAQPPANAVLSQAAPKLKGKKATSKTKAKAKGLKRKPVKLKVTTTNIRYGWTDDYRYMPKYHLQWLKKQKSDVIGLQEVNKGHTSASYMDLFLLYKSYFPGRWFYGDGNYGFGNATWSRYPVIQSRLLRFKSKDMLRRSCLWTRISIKGRNIDIYNTHLSHLAHPNLVRQAQIKELIGWLKKNKTPWIVMGDFNAEPQHPEIQAMLKVSHPIFRKKPELLKAPTYSSLKPRIRIDFIFFSKHFTPHTQQIHDVKGSTDHSPISTVLELR